MNAFHMFWSSSPDKRNFKDYFILTLLLSAMQWKENNAGKLVFYSDKRTLDFFERYGLTDLWDACDDNTIDREVRSGCYDTTNFFTIGKFVALREELCPCALIDVDLVIWDDLQPILQGMDAAFTHWENASYSPWYCKREELNTVPGYEFHDAWDFSSRAANTSFIYFNNEKLKNYYVDCALQYMKNNIVTPRKPENPELIFVEQRLLTMCLDEWNLWEKACPLIDIIWDGRKGRFILTDSEPEGWDFFNLDNHSIATHTWIAKSMIEKNRKYRTYMCCRAIEHILALDHRMYDLLKKIRSVQKYLTLLDHYETTGRMLDKKIVSRILYRK